jgi:hypothetical protein
MAVRAVGGIVTYRLGPKQGISLARGGFDGGVGLSELAAVTGSWLAGVGAVLVSVGCVGGSLAAPLWSFRLGFSVQGSQVVGDVLFVF